MEKKRSVFLFGCAVMVIAALFTLAGCPSPTNSDPTSTNSDPTLDPAQFQGTWNGTGDVAEMQYIFTGTAYEQKVSGQNSRKGTFTITATNLTLNETYFWTGSDWIENDDTSTCLYTLSGNTLTLYGSDTYTKQ